MTLFHEESGIQIHHGNCRTLPLPDASVHCCVTSPPYWGLRDYGVEGQIGLEPTPEEYVASMVEVFREVRRVLRDDGTLWLNLGDSYARNGGEPGGGNRELLHMEGKQRRMRAIPENGYGLKPKDLVGIPWRVAFALQADGWYLRSDIIWHKPNPMPESVTDRPTKAHEYVFLLAKSERYYFDALAISEPSKGWNGSKFDDPRDLTVRPTTGRNRWQERKDAGEGSRRGFSQNQPAGCGQVGIGETRNKRSVWTVPTEPYPEAHFATFPTDLIKPCILAGCPAGGIVLDNFGGSGTTMQVARFLGRQGVMVELNEAYCALAAKRLSQGVLDLTEAPA